MASIGHLAVGLAAGRSYARDPKRVARAMAAFCLLSYLPDFDAIGFKLGIAYAAPWGHRGALHSFAVAVLAGLLAGLVGRAFGQKLFRVALLAFAVIAVHDVLDTLTDGGLGIALFWPFTNHRYFAPWTPLPVAPIGLGLISPRGFFVLGVELVVFGPLWVYSLWPRPPAAREGRSVVG